MVNIVFPPHEDEDASLKVIRFEVLVDGDSVQCSVPYRVLDEFFDAEYSDPLFAFMTGRSKIEESIRQKINSPSYQVPDDIVIAEDDIRESAGKN